MGYWFGRKIKAKTHVSAEDFHTYISKGWVPIVFTGFGNSIDAITLIKI